MTQTNRLETEWQAIKPLASEARFWTVERNTEPSESAIERWLLTFSANFISKVTTASQWQATESVAEQTTDSDVVELGNELMAEVSFPINYPESPPTIELRTSTFHPNIAADGIVSLADIGIVWNAEVSMDLVIERFWNVIRGSYVDTNNPINIGAGRWFKSQTELTLPIDERPLTEEATVNRNIISYRRKGEAFNKPNTSPTQQQAASRHVIHDDSQAAGNDVIHFID